MESIIGNNNWKNEIAQFRNFVVHGDVNVRLVLSDKRSRTTAYEVLLLLFELQFLVEVGFTERNARLLIERRVEHWKVVEKSKPTFPPYEMQPHNRDRIICPHRRWPLRVRRILRCWAYALGHEFPVNNHVASACPESVTLYLTSLRAMHHHQLENQNVRSHSVNLAVEGRSEVAPMNKSF